MPLEEKSGHRRGRPPDKKNNNLRDDFLKSPRKLSKQKLSRFTTEYTHFRTKKQMLNKEDAAFKHTYNKSPPGDLSRTKSLTNRDLTDEGHTDALGNSTEVLQVIQKARSICHPQKEEDKQNAARSSVGNVNTVKTNRTAEGKPNLHVSDKNSKNTEVLNVSKNIPDKVGKAKSANEGVKLAEGEN